MPFKKRRPMKSISKNQVRLNRREAEERMANSAGSLLTRFPFVKNLEIQLDFTGTRGELLDSEHRIFQAGDLLNFSVNCPGRCGNGRIEMETVVLQMFQNHENSRDISGRCRELLYPGSSETCGVEIRGTMVAQYAPATPREQA